MKCLFVTGVTGSGKTTIAKYISQEFPVLEVIFVGELLRKKAEHDEILHSYIQMSLPVPQEYYEAVIRENFASLEDRQRSCVYDMKILSETQNQVLNSIILKQNIEVYVLYLDVPFEEARRRVLERKRDDDQEERIEARFELDILSLQYFDKLSNKKKDWHIDTEKPMNEIQKEVYDCVTSIFPEAIS